MKTLSANTTTVVLTSLFRGFDAEAYRASLAKTAFETAISQRGRWIDNTCLADSTLWIPCHVLKLMDVGEFGIWHRLSYTSGKNVCVILCELPTGNCTYWKHTNWEDASSTSWLAAVLCIKINLNTHSKQMISGLFMITEVHCNQNCKSEETIKVGTGEDHYKHSTKTFIKFQISFRTSKI